MTTNKLSMVEYISAAVKGNADSVFKITFVNHDSFIAKVTAIGTDWIEFHPHKRGLEKFNIAHILSFQDVTGDPSYEWKDWTASRKEALIIQK